MDFWEKRWRSVALVQTSRCKHRDRVLLTFHDLKQLIRAETLSVSYIRIIKNPRFSLLKCSVSEAFREQLIVLWLFKCQPDNNGARGITGFWTLIWIAWMGRLITPLSRQELTSSRTSARFIHRWIGVKLLSFSDVRINLISNIIWRSALVNETMLLYHMACFVCWTRC